MLYLGFNTLPRSVVRSAYFDGRSDNADVIPLKAMTSPEDPYKSPNVDSTSVKHPSVSLWKHTAIGFLAGASIPFAFATYAIFRSNIHAKIDSTGGFASGAVSLWVLLLIFIVSPLAGTIGAVLARLYAKRT